MVPSLISDTESFTLEENTPPSVQRIKGWTYQATVSQAALWVGPSQHRNQLFSGLGAPNTWGEGEWTENSEQEYPTVLGALGIGADLREAR